MSDPHKKRRDCLPESLWEAYEAGFAAGMDAEDTRILSVHKASLERHEALTEEMMLDGRTTEGEAAMAVLAAEREIMNRARQADARTQAAMLNVKWQSDASLRNRFRRNFSRYWAFAANSKLAVVNNHEK